MNAGTRLITLSQKDQHKKKPFLGTVPLVDYLSTKSTKTSRTADKVEGCLKVELQAVILRTTMPQRHNIAPSNDVTKIDGENKQ